MATPVGDAAESGLDAGIARAERYGLRIEAAYAEDEARYPEELELPLSFTRRLLEGGEASERFCELFAEMLAVAAISRSYYGDEPLTESALHDYLIQSFSVMNSFRHA
jgi:hypothetical protein